MDRCVTPHADSPLTSKERRSYPRTPVREGTLTTSVRSVSIRSSTVGSAGPISERLSVGFKHRSQPRRSRSLDDLSAKVATDSVAKRDLLTGALLGQQLVSRLRDAGRAEESVRKQLEKVRESAEKACRERDSLRAQLAETEHGCAARTMWDVRERHDLRQLLDDVIAEKAEKEDELCATEAELELLRQRCESLQCAEREARRMSERDPSVGHSPGSPRGWRRASVVSDCSLQTVRDAALTSVREPLSGRVVTATDARVLHAVREHVESEYRQQVVELREKLERSRAAAEGTQAELVELRRQLRDAKARQAAQATLCSPRSPDARAPGAAEPRVVPWSPPCHRMLNGLVTESFHRRRSQWEIDEKERQRIREASLEKELKELEIERNQRMESARQRIDFMSPSPASGPSIGLPQPCSPTTDRSYTIVGTESSGEDECAGSECDPRVPRLDFGKLQSPHQGGRTPHSPSTGSPHHHQLCPLAALSGGSASEHGGDEWDDSGRASVAAPDAPEVPVWLPAASRHWLLLPFTTAAAAAVRSAVAVGRAGLRQCLEAEPAAMAAAERDAVSAALRRDDSGRSRARQLLRRAIPPSYLPHLVAGATRCAVRLPARSARAVAGAAHVVLSLGAEVALASAHRAALAVSRRMPRHLRRNRRRRTTATRRASARLVWYTEPTSASKMLSTLHRQVWAVRIAAGGRAGRAAHAVRRSLLRRAARWLPAHFSVPESSTEYFRCT
eukprot:TRINITY_DN19223_c0_g1_i1.p1 TRINITY_DN19223_c0_g1~~TRINITY_DN19223_c0_g1_i1.p1  ORF type:complete len:734 (+),score=143.30 TRINITY_DN19223_c0_g1_i1:62-2263(+)